MYMKAINLHCGKFSTMRCLFKSSCVVSKLFQILHLCKKRVVKHVRSISIVIAVLACNIPLTHKKLAKGLPL